LLGEKVTMTPRYFTWACTTCDQPIIDEDCVNDGKYCAIDEDRLMYSGSEIIKENLRQKCIWMADPEIWWDYMERAHAACYTDFTEDCSKAVHQDLKISWDKTLKCVADSFTDNNTDNKLLGADAIEWVLRGPHFVPAVVINNITYRGTLDPENVFNAICQGYKDP